MNPFLVLFSQDLSASDIPATPDLWTIFIWTTFYQKQSLENLHNDAG